MFAAANAAVVPGKVIDTVLGLAWTVATCTLGTKSRWCTAVAWACCHCEYRPHAPRKRPPASSRIPPSANTRPPDRRRTCRRSAGSFWIASSTTELSRRLRATASLRLGASKFIGEVLEHTVGRDAVVALAQHGEQIRDDEQSGGGSEQK